MADLDEDKVDEIFTDIENAIDGVETKHANNSPEFKEALTRFFEFRFGIDIPRDNDDDDDPDDD